MLGRGGLADRVVVVVVLPDVIGAPANAVLAGAAPGLPTVGEFAGSEGRRYLRTEQFCFS